MILAWASPFNYHIPGYYQKSGQACTSIERSSTVTRHTDPRANAQAHVLVQKRSLFNSK